MGKKRLLEIHYQCLDLVRRKPPDFLVFKKLTYCGWCLYNDEDLIAIDHRKDLLRTAYHECVHYLYPEWSETQVIYAESRLINQVPLLDITYFHKHLAAKLYRSELQRAFVPKKKKKKKNPCKSSSR